VYFVSTHVGACAAFEGYCGKWRHKLQHERRFKDAKKWRRHNLKTQKNEEEINKTTHQARRNKQTHTQASKPFFFLNFRPFFRSFARPPSQSGSSSKKSESLSNSFLLFSWRRRNPIAVQVPVTAW